MWKGWRGHGKAPAGGNVSKGATLVSRRWPRKRAARLFQVLSEIPFAFDGLPLAGADVEVQEIN
jgi:hypothetical protein